MKAGLFYLFETLGEISPSEFYHQALEEVVYGEELGFSAVCPAEHHFSAHYGIMPRVELFLSWVASRTEKSLLWPMVILAPLRNPIQLAEDLAVLDQFSKGRVVASFGSGYRKYEFTPFGQDISENADRLREVAEATVRLWREEEVNHEGKFHVCREAGLMPRPYQDPHPPVFITTSRPEQIQWAAERGYNVFPAAGFNAATMKRDYAVYSEAAKAAGQPDQEMKPFFKWIYVHDDHQTGVNEGMAYIMRTMMAFAQGGGRLMSHLIGRALDSWDDNVEKPEWLTTKVEEMMSSGASYEDMVKSGWLPFVMGDAAHVTEVLQEMKNAGGNFFIGGFKCGPMPQEKVKRSMQLFAEKVLPKL